jgi:hypothetical protein
MEPVRLSTLTRRKLLDQFFEHHLAAKALRHIASINRAAVTGYSSANDPSLSESKAEFADLVDEASAFGKFVGLTLQAVPQVRISLPVENPVAAWVAEGAPIPPARGTWAHVILSENKIATIFVTVEDLLRTADPMLRAVLVQQARDHVVRGFDQKFLSNDAATNASPAGLTASAPTLGDGSPSNLERDFAEAVAYVRNGAPVRPVVFVSKRVAVYLAASNLALFRNIGVNSGTIAQIPVITTPAAGNRIIYCDGAAVATYNGPLEVESSGVTSVEMTDTPSGNSATGAGAQMVSLFQTGGAAVRLIKTADWKTLADDAVAVIEVTELAGSPS